MVEICVALIPEANDKYLNEKQRVDYRNRRLKFIEWLSVFGKNPDPAEGYAEDTVYRDRLREIVPRYRSHRRR